MAKAMRVPMTYQPTSEQVYWTVTRERYWHGLKKERLGWFFTDNDGYQRFGGDTWLELVDRFSQTAENYAMAHRLN